MEDVDSAAESAHYPIGITNGHDGETRRALANEAPSIAGAHPCRDCAHQSDPSFQTQCWLQNDFWGARDGLVPLRLVLYHGGHLLELNGAATPDSPGGKLKKLSDANLACIAFSLIQF